MSVPDIQGNPSSISHLRATDAERSPARFADEEMERALQVFLAERTRLLRVAFRVVGDAAGAEDVVQDAWVRWQRTDRHEIKNPAAWLTTATTHLAINAIQSARHRHEQPTDSLRVAAEPSMEPTGQLERAGVVERMLGLLMARLSPAELAAYLLRKCFDYPYQEIAVVLRTTVPNARQLVCRSRAGIGVRPARHVDVAARRRLAAAFSAAAAEGDLGGLETLLADHASRCRPPGSGPACVRRGDQGRRVRNTGATASASVA